MRRTLAIVATALLTAGCTAAAAQTPDTRAEALNARITALETRIAALETWADTTAGTMATAFERAETNRAGIAAVALAQTATADEVAAVDANAASAHLVRSFIAPTGGPPFVVPEGGSLTFGWRVTYGSTDGVRLTMPTIDGLTFSPSVLTWAAGETGTRDTTVTAEHDADADDWHAPAVPHLDGWGISAYTTGKLIHIVDDD